LDSSISDGSQDVEKNAEKAVIGCERGLRPGYGCGVDSNLAHAIYWYQEAVENGIYLELGNKVSRLCAELEANQ